MQVAFGACNASFMFVAGAPAGGYCASTCSRCPPGTSLAVSPAAAPSPAVIIPPANAPGLGSLSLTCFDAPPNDDFSCAQLVRLQFADWHELSFCNGHCSLCIKCFVCNCKLNLLWVFLQARLCLSHCSALSTKLVKPTPFKLKFKAITHHRHTKRV